MVCPRVKQFGKIESDITRNFVKKILDFVTTQSLTDGFSLGEKPVYESTGYTVASSTQVLDGGVALSSQIRIQS